MAEWISPPVPAGGDRAPGGRRLAVNKINWQKAGRVTEPGRYMFTFGWLTVAAEDLAVWEQFPNAAFTFVHTASPTDAVEEFRLGAFEVDKISRTVMRTRVCT